MGKVVVFQSVTLDGVMQAPARPDEDTRDGFPYGGWAVPYAEPGIGRVTGESMATAGGLLLGRRTYIDFYSVWPNRTDNPFTEVLNNAPKYVASRTLQEPLPWMNSILIKGDVSKEVAKLKGQLEKDLVILGSGELIQALLQHKLIDQYILFVHPLVLGTGRHLFVDGSAYSALQLIDSDTTSTGVVVARYQMKEGV